MLNKKDMNRDSLNANSMNQNKVSLANDYVVRVERGGVIYNGKYTIQYIQCCLYYLNRATKPPVFSDILPQPPIRSLVDKLFLVSTIALSSARDGKLCEDHRIKFHCASLTRGLKYAATHRSILSLLHDDKKYRRNCKSQ